MNTSAEYTAIINLIYPVGSIYYANNSDMNPEKWIPGTAWESVVLDGKDEEYGSYLISQGKTDLITPREFTLGALGGNEEVTLTVSQLPKHTHSKVYHEKKSQSVWSDVCHVRYMTQYGSDKVFTSSTGGNQPHNNIPPSILIYAWERIK